MDSDQEHTTKKRGVAWLAWWLGVPLFVTGVSYLPFVVFHCAEGWSTGCLRMPVVGQLIMDFGLYSSFISSSAIEINELSLFPGLLRELIRIIHLVAPALTPAEIWMILRIVSGIVGWWTASWVLSAWTNLSLPARRISASVLWFAVFLPMGFRTGVFSWYLPFGFVMLIAVSKLTKSIVAKRWKHAISWSALALVASIVYPWFLVFAALWIAAIWAEVIVTRLTRRVNVLIWIAGSVFAVATVFAALYLLPDLIVAKISGMERVGLAFTHLPILSNVLIAAFIWPVLSVLIVIRNGEELDPHFRVLHLRAWVVTIAAWLSSLLMGIYFHNDHFRIMVLLFSWISGSSLVYSVTKSMVRSVRHAAWIACLGLLAVLYYIFKPYAFDGDYLNAIHLFVWAVIVIGAALYAFPVFRPSARFVAIGAIIGAVLIGGLPYGVLLAMESARQPELRTYEGVFAWMRSNVPESERVCVLSGDADLVASQSGRTAFFSERDIYATWRGDLQEDLAVLASLRQPDEELSAAWIDKLHAEDVSCMQYGAIRRALSRFVSEERMDRLADCRRDELDQERAFVRSLSEPRDVSGRIREVCPWVMTRSDDPLKQTQDMEVLYADDYFMLYGYPR